MRKIGLGCINLNAVATSNIIHALRHEAIGQGSFIPTFEKEMAKLLGIHYAYMVSTGEMADVIALNAVDKGEGKDEVIVPALTFVAQVHSILHAGYKPVFCDVDETGQMDPNMTEHLLNERTLAIFPAHLLGRVARIVELSTLSRMSNIPLVEDACEALGASFNNVPVGTYGDAGTYSFYATHTVCTGEGGLVVVKDREVGKRVAAYRNHGRPGESVHELFAYDRVGFNGKSTNLHAAIGCSIVPQIHGIVEKRRENVKYLNDKLGLRWMAERPFERFSPHCYPVFFRMQIERDEALERITKAGIECRVVMSNCAKLPHLRKYATTEYPMSERLATHGLYVPCHQRLDKDDLDYIIEVLGKEDLIDYA